MSYVNEVGFIDEKGQLTTRRDLLYEAERIEAAWSRNISRARSLRGRGGGTPRKRKLKGKTVEAEQARTVSPYDLDYPINYYPIHMPYQDHW
jgi:hypothetical protein